MYPIESWLNVYAKNVNSNWKTSDFQYFCNLYDLKVNKPVPMRFQLNRGFHEKLNSVEFENYTTSYFGNFLQSPIEIKVNKLQISIEKLIFVVEEYI